MFLLQLQQHKQHYIYWLVSFLWPYSVVIDERRFRQFLAVTSREWQDGGFSGWRGKMNGAKSLTQCLRSPCLAYCTQSRSLKTPNTSRLEQREAGDTLFPFKLSGNHTSAKTGPISKHLRIAGFGWLWIWMACKGGDLNGWAANKIQLFFWESCIACCALPCTTNSLVQCSLKSDQWIGSEVYEQMFLRVHIVRTIQCNGTYLYMYIFF